MSVQEMKPLVTKKEIAPADKDRYKGSVGQLEVDLTPESLEGIVDPLTINVTEILPTIVGVVSLPYDLPGIIINTGTHLEEGTPSRINIELEERLIQEKDRLQPIILTRGLYSAVEKLRTFMLHNDMINNTPMGEDVIEQIDINRCFIDLDKEPENFFEELTQNFLKFITYRYSSKMTFVDVHADPEEHATYSHIILDRTLPRDIDKKEFYNWAVDTFDLSVMWDIDEKDGYSGEEHLDRSLSAKLLQYGYKAVTYESSAGKAVDDLKTTIVMYNLYNVLLRKNILPFDLRRYMNLRKKLLDDLNAKLGIKFEGLPVDPNFNKIMGEDIQLKRHYLVVRIEEGSHFERARGILTMNGEVKMVTRGTVLGEVVTDGYPRKRTPVVMDADGFPLGIPEEGNLFPSLGKPELTFTLAIKET